HAGTFDGERAVDRCPRGPGYYEDTTADTTDRRAAVRAAGWWSGPRHLQHVASAAGEIPQSGRRHFALGGGDGEQSVPRGDVEHAFPKVGPAGDVELRAS